MKLTFLLIEPESNEIQYIRCFYYLFQGILMSSILSCSAPLYTLKFVVGNVAAMCGPIFSIALFFWVGNVWEVSDFPSQQWSFQLKPASQSGTIETAGTIETTGVWLPVVMLNYMQFLVNMADVRQLTQSILPCVHIMCILCGYAYGYKSLAHYYSPKLCNKARLRSRNRCH
jgi:hypothetical protein